MESDADSAGLSSMTGFGRACARLEGWELQVECRSVNHKRLSIRVDTPDEVSWLESKINKRLKTSLHRGRVDVRLQLQPAGGDDDVEFDRIDERRFGAVARELNHLADEHRLHTPVSIEAAWEYRDFFECTTADAFCENDADALMEGFDEALDQLLVSRRREGRGIADELCTYLGRLASLIDEVETLKKRADDEEWSRVEARLREAIEQFEVDEIDEGRLAQEVAYYVEKGDISEEIQRARSHIEQLDEVVANADGAVGKKVDFYLQELIRETNTMGSKSHHPEMTDCVIEMKSLVEKMREQAANVE